LLFFLLSLLAMSARAQITITSDEFLNGYIPSNLSGFIATEPLQFIGLIAQSGANQNWDFYNYSYTEQIEADSFTFIPIPPGAPFSKDTNFNFATNVFRVVTVGVSGWQYVYVRLDSAGYWLVGDVIDSFEVSSYIQLLMVPPIQQEKFPLTYQTSWKSSGIETSPDASPGSIKVWNAVVDGYGTLTLPRTGPLQALRQETLATSRDTFNGHNTIDTFYSFQWFTREGYSVTINADAKQNPEQVFYSIPPMNSSVAQSYTPTGKLNLLLSQNPVSNAGADVIYTLPNTGSVQVELMDELGRNVRMLQNGFASAGQNTIAIDPQYLEAGTYFVRVETDGMSAMQKLVIAK
jgi:hypothetical protein